MAKYYISEFAGKFVVCRSNDTGLVDPVRSFNTREEAEMMIKHRAET